MVFHDHSSTLERVVAFDIGMERVTANDGVVAMRVAAVSSDFWDPDARASTCIPSFEAGRGRAEGGR